MHFWYCQAATSMFQGYVQYSQIQSKLPKQTDILVFWRREREEESSADTQGTLPAASLQEKISTQSILHCLDTAIMQADHFIVSLFNWTSEYHNTFSYTQYYCKIVYNVAKIDCNIVDLYALLTMDYNKILKHTCNIQYCIVCTVCCYCYCCISLL